MKELLQAYSQLCGQLGDQEMELERVDFELERLRARRVQVEQGIGETRTRLRALQRVAEFVGPRPAAEPPPPAPAEPKESP